MPAYSLKEDTLALQKIKLDKKINTRMKKIKAEDRYQQVLETMAAIHFKELNLEKAKEKYTTKKVFDKESYLEYLKTILETKEVITKKELEKLALLRVQNISDYLVKKKIEKTRIVIEKKIENITSKNNSVAINFKIDIKK